MINQTNLLIFFYEFNFKLGAPSAMTAGFKELSFRGIIKNSAGL